jgi:hypothetical protein
MPQVTQQFCVTIIKISKWCTCLQAHHLSYIGWYFNSGNYLFTTDTCPLWSCCKCASAARWSTLEPGPVRIPTATRAHSSYNSATQSLSPPHCFSSGRWMRSHPRAPQWHFFSTYSQHTAPQMCRHIIGTQDSQFQGELISDLNDEQVISLLGSPGNHCWCSSINGHETWSVPYLGLTVLAVIFLSCRHTEYVTREWEWWNQDLLLCILYSFLWSWSTSFWEVILAVSLSAASPKMADAPTLPAYGLPSPAVLSPWWPWPQGGALQPLPRSALLRPLCSF